MARRLIATVVVGGVAYTAGSKVPDDVAEQITNPAAWAEDEAKSDEPQESAEAEERPRKQSSRRSS